MDKILSLKDILNYITDSLCAGLIQSTILVDQDNDKLVKHYAIFTVYGATFYVDKSNVDGNDIFKIYNSNNQLIYPNQSMSKDESTTYPFVYLIDKDIQYINKNKYVGYEDDIRYLEELKNDFLIFKLDKREDIFLKQMDMSINFFGMEESIREKVNELKKEQFIYEMDKLMSLNLKPKNN